MAFYENTIVAKQDLAEKELKSIVKKYSSLIENSSGKIVKVEDFCFHDLRHTTASYFAMSGVPIQTISRILGHKTIQMTMRYTHLNSAHLREAIQKISTVIVEEDIS